MYPITFLTSYLLLVFCHFGAAEPPPSHGYGPPSPVEFGSNEVSSHEQYNAPDFSSFGFGSNQPSSYNAPSTGYTKSGPSFAPQFNAGSNYKTGLGKGGVSSSYISIVHGAGNAGSPGKLRPAPYTVQTKGPAQVINSYTAPNFGSPAAFSDIKSFGGSPYSSGEVYSSSGNSYNKGYGGNAAYSGSFESYSPGASDYNKGYESGGVSDEVGSYSSGGPSYATFTGSSKVAYTPSFSHGSRGNAFSTSNVNVGGGGGGKVSGHGNFHAPSYTGSFKPSGAKVYNRYNGPSNFGASSSSYSAPSFSSGETGYNSRALKTGYSADNADDFGSSEDANAYNGGFSDGAGFKVQSSYSTG